MNDTDLLARTDIAAMTIARGDWRLRHDAADIRVLRHRGRPFRGGHAWRQLRAQADRFWAQAEREGEQIFGRPPGPPGLLRLQHWAVEQHALMLTLGRTWYWAHVG